MPSKLQMYEQMADQTAKQVTGSFGEWTAFLETMGRLYKYPFHEQLMFAFLVSPLGLPMLAAWLIGQMQRFRYFVQDAVYG